MQYPGAGQGQRRYKVTAAGEAAAKRIKNKNCFAVSLTLAYAGIVFYC